MDPAIVKDTDFLKDDASSWRKEDWERLRRLQAGFWAGGVPAAWQDERDAMLYEAVFGERIVWKWEAVLRILDAQGWRPQSERIFDWGCGTGGPSRLVGAWGNIRTVHLHDVSILVRSWAARRHREEGFAVLPGVPQPGSEPFLLLLSHVLSELSESTLAELSRWTAAAHEILWVEPGERRSSRALGNMREVLLREQGFQIVAPCTHRGACPVSQPGKEQEWCHFFTRPPGWIFQSAHWREIASRLEIDLRSLPYSFLALSKNIAQVHRPDDQRYEKREENNDEQDSALRFLGRAEIRKGEATQLACGPEGLVRWRWQKRDNPTLYRELKHHQEEMSGKTMNKKLAQ